MTAAGIMFGRHKLEQEILLAGSDDRSASDGASIPDNSPSAAMITKLQYLRLISAVLYTEQESTLQTFSSRAGMPLRSPLSMSTVLPLRKLRILRIPSAM